MVLQDKVKLIVLNNNSSKQFERKKINAVSDSDTADVCKTS
jgi:hypothetical protein